MNMLTNKYVWALLLILAAGLGGFYTGRGQKQESTVVHDVQTVTRTVDHVVTVVRTVRPDGSVTEETKTEDKQIDKEKQDDSTASTSTLISSNYSLGIRYHLQPLSFSDTIANPYKGLEATVGRRIVGDIWIDLGVQPLNRDVSLGVRIDL